MSTKEGIFELPSGFADYTVGEAITLLPSYKGVFFPDQTTRPLADRNRSNSPGQALLRVGTGLSSLFSSGIGANVVLAQELPPTIDQGEVEVAGAVLEADTEQALGCEFNGGFKALHDQIPEIVGDCASNERRRLTYDINNRLVDTGENLQDTTRGRLTWRRDSDSTSFSDGIQTWTLAADGSLIQSNTEFASADPGINVEVAPAVVTPTPRLESTPPQLTREQKIAYVNNLNLKGVDGNGQSALRQAIQEAIQKAPRNVDTNYINTYLARTYPNIPAATIMNELSSMDMIDILSGVDYIVAVPKPNGISASWRPSTSNGKNGYIEINPGNLGTLSGWSVEASRIRRAGTVIKEAAALQIFASALRTGVEPATAGLFAENASMRILYLYLVGNTGSLSPEERGALLPFYDRASQDPTCC
jgi:hypothetical protein